MIDYEQFYEKMLIRNCENKVWFATEAECRESISREVKYKLYAYHCTICKGWHKTKHKTKNKKKK